MDTSCVRSRVQPHKHGSVGRRKLRLPLTRYATTGNNYPAILSQLSVMQVINKGITGESSGQGKHRLPVLLDKY